LYSADKAAEYSVIL